MGLEWRSTEMAEKFGLIHGIPFGLSALCGMCWTQAREARSEKRLMCRRGSCECGMELTRQVSPMLGGNGEETGGDRGPWCVTAGMGLDRVTCPEWSCEGRAAKEIESTIR